jgi:hypothetical protein
VADRFERYQFFGTCHCNGCCGEGVSGDGFAEDLECGAEDFVLMIVRGDQGWNGGQDSEFSLIFAGYSMVGDLGKGYRRAFTTELSPQRSRRDTERARIF